MMTTVSRSPSIYVSCEDMDNAMLNFLRDSSQVHVISAASRAFDLELVTIELMEPLKTLDQQEIHGQPFKLSLLEGRIGVQLTRLDLHRKNVRFSED